jgi:TRAP transporter TAXI family solute receptor
MSPPPIAPRGRRRPWRSLTATLVALAVLALLLHIFNPLPPRSLVMSTGVEDGAYHVAALRYREILHANGVRLDLKPSSGSQENMERLLAGKASVAFVQGGLGPMSTSPESDPDDVPLRALATVAIEPIWIFTHSLDLARGLGPLAGRRVAVGVAHSGNEKVAVELLQAYGVGEGGAAGTQFVREGGLKVAGMLRRHEIDAAILVTASQAPAVQQLLADPSIRLASLEQVEGLARRFPYLQIVTLRRGSIDPGQDRPPQDVALLATEANLVVREDLHPELAYLLLKAARHVHEPGSLLRRPGEFPSPQGVDFALSDQAERWFRNGPPFLHNYLPFWAANILQRVLLVLLPVAAILFPLGRLLPEFLAWRRQSRLYRSYGELKFLEQELASHTLGDEERRAAGVRLDRIEEAIFRTAWPLELSDRVYTLRQHVEFVRAHYVLPPERMAGAAAEGGAGQATRGQV